jgi:hypothetical protein
VASSGSVTIEVTEEWADRMWTRATLSQKQRFADTAIKEMLDAL